VVLIVVVSPTHPVETLELLLGRGPDICDFPIVVRARARRMLLRYSIPSGRGPDVGGSLSGQSEGPTHVETLKMPSGRGPEVGSFLSSRQGEGPT